MTRPVGPAPSDEGSSAARFPSASPRRSSIFMTASRGGSARYGSGGRPRARVASTDRARRLRLSRSLHGHRRAVRPAATRCVMRPMRLVAALPRCGRSPARVASSMPGRRSPSSGRAHAPAGRSADAQVPAPGPQRWCRVCGGALDPVGVVYLRRLRRYRLPRLRSRWSTAAPAATMCTASRSVPYSWHKARNLVVSATDGSSCTPDVCWLPPGTASSWRSRRVRAPSSAVSYLTTCPVRYDVIRTSPQASHTSAWQSLVERSRARRHVCPLALSGHAGTRRFWCAIPCHRPRRPAPQSTSPCRLGRGCCCRRRRASGSRAAMRRRPARTARPGCRARRSRS